MALAVSTTSSGGGGSNGILYGSVSGGSTPISIAGFQNTGASDTLLLVFWGISDATTNIGTVTAKWGSQTLTEIGSALLWGSSSDSSYVFGLVSPTSGSQGLTISWTGAGGLDSYAVFGISFTGSVSNSVAAATYAFQSNSNSTANTTSTVTTAASVTTGDIAVAMQLAQQTGFSAVSGTEIDIFNVTGGFNAGCNRSTGAGSAITLTGTCASALWGSTIVAVAAAAAASQTPYQPYFQQMLASKRKEFIGWREGYDHRWRRWRRDRKWATSSTRLLVPSQGLLLPNHMRARSFLHPLKRSLILRSGSAVALRK